MHGNVFRSKIFNAFNILFTHIIIIHIIYILIYSTTTQRILQLRFTILLTRDDCKSRTFGPPSKYNNMHRIIHDMVTNNHPY
jgi:hypothetical protein